MILRSAQKEIDRLATQYPVITIVGPRQSGKTTLCRQIFKNHNYVSLEKPDDRGLANNDPDGFLSRYQPPVIIDEIQYAPSLLSVIQVWVDQKKKAGDFILTGSQQFELMKSLTQSLAGRTALLELLPLSFEELYSHDRHYRSVEDYLYYGFYPRIYDENLNPTEAYSFYVSTYLERDIRSLIQVKDYLLFDRFIKVCASRTGQVLNLTSIGNECGISHNTVSSWLSLLETSFIVHRLSPHFNNFSKRLIKAPKLYFYDVGLVSFLLGIESANQLKNHPLKGSLFETMVVSEMIKFRFNRVRKSNLYFFRDNSGHEVDILIDNGSVCNPVEIKLSQTVNESFFSQLRYYQDLQKKSLSKSFLIYGGNESYRRKEAGIFSFTQASKVMEESSIS